MKHVLYRLPEKRVIFGRRGYAVPDNRAIEISDIKMVAVVNYFQLTPKMITAGVEPRYRVVMMIFHIMVNLNTPCYIKLTYVAFNAVIGGLARISCRRSAGRL
jgi:hypothetical protein